MKRPLSVLSLVLVLAGCGGAQVRVAEPTVDTSDPAQLYPMGEGFIWTYDIDTQTEMATLGIYRVTRMSGDEVAIRPDGGDEVVYVRTPEGIVRQATGRFVLRGPLREGAEWPASADGTRMARVTSMHATADVGAGHYEDCVEVSEAGGDAGLTVRTVYCAGVGPVIVETHQELITSMEGGITVTATLRGFQQGEDE